LAIPSAKDDESGIERGQRVGNTNQYSIPVAVAVERVIRGKEDVGTIGNTQCVENLCASINPDVNIIVETFPVWVEVVVSDASRKTILLKSHDEKGGEDDVWEEGDEVNHFPIRLHPFDKGYSNKSPRKS